jgi:three-Cys-motif partner protein
MDASIYQSSKNTSFKQSSLRHMLTKTMAIIGAIRSNPEKTWSLKYDPIYFDLFSGKGRDPKTDEPGSPLIFLEIAAQQDYRFQAHFYERDHPTIRELATNLAKVEQPRNVTYVLHPKDNTAVKDVLPRRPAAAQFGIAYADPSDADLNAAMAPLSQIAIAYPSVDIIINYAAASWKRQIKFDHYRNLLDFLKEIPKQKWLIRKPIDRFQWTMLLGTNYLGFAPEEKHFWYDVRKEQGQHLFEKVAYTRDELNVGQMQLFGED